MGIVERHALPLAVSSCDEWRQTMRELLELGLDPTATERILEVLTSLGFADCRQDRYAASAALKDLDAISPGGVDGLGAMWSQVPAFLLRGERYAHMDGPPDAREAVYSSVVSKLALVFAHGA